MDVTYQCGHPGCKMRRAIGGAETPEHAAEIAAARGWIFLWHPGLGQLTPRCPWHARMFYDGAARLKPRTAVNELLAA
jgi:hypothetical protein